MMGGSEADRERRVLLVAPTRRDAELTQNLLARAGLSSLVCDTVQRVSEEITKGAGAILLTEEALSASDITELLQALEDQPSWSDLPVVMLMRGGVQSPAAIRVLSSMKNVTLLERPASTRSVVSVVHAAVRSRERQYQIRLGNEERERLLESERIARAESERANRSKDEFLAVLSHELKSPLNSIAMAVQLLKLGGVSEEDQATMLTTISESVRVQNELIEDLLDVSRIVSGKLHLKKQLFDFRDIIAAALTTTRQSAQLKELEIVRELPDEAAEICGDQGRIQQVVWNLLGNAVKFTPRGGRIVVKVHQGPSDVELSISDTGCGISAAFLPHVFDRFRQADSATTRKHGGLGLGLSIVRQLVQLHGGTIHAESAGEGQGSTFTVVLPRASAESAARQRDLKTRDGNLDGLKILIVDDDRDFAHMMQRVLSEYRAQVISAHSAEEALQRVDDFAPDLLVSDIGMPGTDGYELIQEVRSRGNTPAKLPAAAVTAFAGADDRRRALLAGFQGHIAKPVDVSELMALLASLSGRTGPVPCE